MDVLYNFSILILSYHIYLPTSLTFVLSLLQDSLPNSNRLPTPKLALRALKLRFQHRTLSTLHGFDSLRQ